jgi:hypothetical protein
MSPGRYIILAAAAACLRLDLATRHRHRSASGRGLRIWFSTPCRHVQLPDRPAGLPWIDVDRLRHFRLMTWQRRLPWVGNPLHMRPPRFTRVPWSTRWVLTTSSRSSIRLFTRFSALDFRVLGAWPHGSTLLKSSHGTCSNGTVASTMLLALRQRTRCRSLLAVQAPSRSLVGRARRTARWTARRFSAVRHQPGNAAACAWGALRG